MVRWRENGSNRGRRFDRKGDADAWERELRRRRQLGPLAVAQLTTRASTLGEWIADRWAPEHAATLEQSTRDRYADAYRLHIEPWLGELPLTELTVGRLRTWQADRLADGVGVGTIDKARTVLSSVLRHAAESEAIPGNPLTLVRAPLAEHRDAVTPLAPITVEGIRTVLAGAMDVHVPERIRRGGVRVGGYVIPDERDPLTRQRDATIVSVLAYAGLRPGELRALRWGDVRKATITVERAARPDGTIKSTKNHERRAVRLLAPLATDLAELRLAAGRPADDALVLPPGGEPAADAHPHAVTWTKTDWQVWRARHWDKASRLAGMPASPRPYDLRHSFASLLLAEGRSVHYVARRLGHSPALTLSTYGHLFAEYEHADRIDAEAEIARARGGLGFTRRPAAEDRIACS
ncbi:MAG TPA: tyrosine-type recombinase/integrase [Conexibacter sp.]|nr:tyrosine-type recombinase/integrase [Conexibacter sp.]